MRRRTPDTTWPPARASQPARAAAVKRRPAPVRWSPLAYALVLGIVSAVAVLWFVLIATVVVLVGGMLETQADILVKLGEVTTTVHGDPAPDDPPYEWWYEDPDGPAGRVGPTSSGAGA